jgi:flavin-dependent dehydrogenase
MKMVLSKVFKQVTWGLVKMVSQPITLQGYELHAKYTLFAEGCRGHLGKRLIANTIWIKMQIHNITVSGLKNCGKLIQQNIKQVW